MNKVSRSIPKSVKNELIKRSNGLCEVCGMDISTDKHHIHEWAKGGDNIVENLICLCPTCHRQIPLFLDSSDQKLLQRWHINNIESNESFNYQISNPINSFKIGRVIYINKKNILTFDNKPCIFINSGNKNSFYVNLIMLEGFDPKLLILNNRIILNGGWNLIKNNKGIFLSNKEFFLNFEKENDLINVKLNFSFKGKMFYFGDYTEIDTNKIIGGSMEGGYTGIEISGY